MIKLARNAEARRAVMAQVLAYASELQRHSLEAVEADILGAELRKRGHGSLFEAASKQDQTQGLDEDAFRSNVASSLSQGRFRLVLVLDAAPPELVRSASYLQLVAEGRITLDLITMASYSVGETELLVPQRIDGEAATSEAEAKQAGKAVKKGELSEGSAAFEVSIDSAPVEERARIRQLLEWARTLESDGLVTLESFRGINRWILLPRLVAEGAGLVSVWNDGRGTLQLWKSVFEKKARQFIAPVEASIGGPIKQGGNAKQWDESTLRLLSDAYRHAARTSDDVQ